MYVFFGFFGGSLPGMKVLQEGAWSNLRRVDQSKTKGIEEKVLETLKVQTAGRPRILETWRDGGRRKERGAPEVRKMETRQIDHFRF